MSKPTISGSVPLKSIQDRDTMKWIQGQLALAGYLEKSGVDGYVGPKTLAAFAAFKKDYYLAYPEDIGQSTIDVLADVEEKHDVSDQVDNVPTTTNASAGSKSGRSATFPVVGLIYENEMVVPGSNITWGEMTAGLSRKPISTSDFGSADQVVRNMMEMAKVFGKVRSKFGSPIAINSAYRPPNLSIGAGRSQHKYGRALDVRPLNGDYATLLSVIKSIPEIKGVGIAGPSKGFWHMDIRPGSRVYFNY